MTLFRAITIALSMLVPIISMAGVSNGFRPEVRNIVDRRCVVCHGCYSSPCNLKLDSAWGLDRGASKDDIYETRPGKILAPSRMFQDGYSREVWQSPVHNFHSVTSTENINKSIVLQLLEASQFGTKEPRSFKFDAEKSRSCAKNQNELDEYLKKSGNLAGMPYGTHPLSKKEFEILTSEFQTSFNFLEYPELFSLEQASKNASTLARKFENLLNQTSLKDQLVARYLYEHLFSAHLHFAGTPDREFYRLVRSASLEGPIEEIATRRPYDYPGKNFYYRIKKVVETIVQKNHSPFEINEETLSKLQKDFYQSDYEVTNLPVYGNKAANPFFIFKEIPANIRYKFFLENAYYFIRTFIHGPVCNGQGATNVIRDHFWVVMLDPKYDLLSQNPKFEKDHYRLLNLPASKPKVTTIHGLNFKNTIYQLKAAKAYHKIWQGQLSPHMIWDGNKKDKNAALTVYRHFKSAGVYNGLIGSMPKTVWVMDYSIFERIYYDLVAGFDVYGNSFHKITTRLYMDFLRTESEDMFLSMFDKKSRMGLRSSWNRGYGALKRILTPYTYHQDDKAPFQKNDYAKNFYISMLRHQGDVVGEDLFNHNQETKELLPDYYRHLAKITGTTGSFPRYFPEVSILRIKLKNGQNHALTILANKDRPFANHLFIEPRNPEGDILNIIPGLDVTHVNRFFDLAEDEIIPFVKMVKEMKSYDDWKALVKRFAIDRLSADFWAFADWTFDQTLILHPSRGGVIDFTRLE